MKFTREDAKRLIKDLQNVYLEITEKEYLKQYGVLPTKNDIRPIRTREVLLAYVKGRKGLVAEFTDVNNPMIDTIIWSRGDTAIQIRYLYESIKRRQKGKAIDALYEKVNDELERIFSVNYDVLISNIVVLRREFDSFFDAFSPINVSGCSKGKLDRMRADVTHLSNKWLTLEMNTTTKCEHANLMPSRAETDSIRNLFSMIYNNNRSYLIKGIYGARESDYASLMKLQDKEQLRVALKRLTGIRLVELNRIVNYSITGVANASAKYKALGIKCREEIVSY